jgi:hypothetical protein
MVRATFHTEGYAGQENETECPRSGSVPPSFLNHR